MKLECNLWSILPLSIDSSIIEALEAGLARLSGQGAGQLGDG
ncbi:MAG: hypothetical protein R2865_00685 [Deinococcales bacterium]